MSHLYNRHPLPQSKYLLPFLSFKRFSIFKLCTYFKQLVLLDLLVFNSLFLNSSFLLLFLTLFPFGFRLSIQLLQKVKIYISSCALLGSCAHNSLPPAPGCDGLEFELW